MGNIFARLKEKLIIAVLPNLLRHGISALAGYLLANGLLTPELVDSFINSTLAIAIGLGGLIGSTTWSVTKEKKQIEEKKELKAELVEVKQDAIRAQEKRY